VSADVFVIFVDMLGFGDLVLAEGDDLTELQPAFAREDLYLEQPSLLAFRFVNFHRCVEAANAAWRTSRSGTSIVFSDSAFFSGDKLSDIFALARSLMSSLVDSCVPARMGIAPGTFRSVRFTSDTSAQASYHASQFLGTGIVRAHRTEGCGIPGLRILLHPLLEPLVDRSEDRIVNAWHDREKLREPVTLELNYLDPAGNEWSGPDYEDVLVFDALRNMIAESDPQFHYHYITTFNAYNVMRAQLGRAPYSWDKCIDRDKYDKEHNIFPRGYVPPESQQKE